MWVPSKITYFNPSESWFTGWQNDASEYEGEKGQYLESTCTWFLKAKLRKLINTQIKVMDVIIEKKGERTKTKKKRKQTNFW